MLAEAADDLRSLEETARFFGVSVPTVRAWIVDGCPVRQRGGPGVAYAVSLRDVAGWRERRETEDAERAQARAASDAQLKLALLGDDALTGADDATLSARARAEALRAEYDRTRLAQLRRELVPARAVQLRMVETMAGLRSRLRQLPDLVAPEFNLTDGQAERMLAIIDAALEDCADEMARHAG